MRVYHFVFFVIVMVSFGCTSVSSEQKKRPREVWVIRSVLDRQPRMLTLALDSNCYVAYDVSRCKLVRAWKGGIVLQGAAYTNQPNLQPVSWGSSYTDRFANDWLVERDKVKDSFHLINRGYEFVNGRVRLKFDLVLSTGDTIRIEESPEVIKKGDILGLERQLTLSSVPNGVNVSLGDGSGTVKLNDNGVSTLVTWFTSPLQKLNSAENISDHIGRNYMDKSDCFTCHETDQQNVGPSFRLIAKKYKGVKGAAQMLIDKVKAGGTGVWGNTAMTPHPALTPGEISYMIEYILSLESSDEATVEQETPPVSTNTSPGDGAPLVGVHPSFNLQTIHPESFRPRVGGMAFLPDKRLVVTTWDSTGGVYILDNVESGDTSKIKVKRIAAGLAEPLGVEVVNGEIYVLQKHELTKLIDHDGDDLIDEYASICNTWGATADFHEFSFGLQYKDGYFYATLSMAMRLLSTERQLPDRGTVIRIAPNGYYERVIYGLRQPNGICLGPGDEIFITDNQGQWLPASKLIHVKKGEYHGMRWGIPDSITQPPPMALPAIWMPEDEIANSPSQPVLIEDGIYKGQMLHGDVTAGGIQRDFIELVNGAYQGCIFRFTQGLETGVNRLKIGPDGAIYIGGLGLVGGWSYNGKQYGLQKMQYNGTPVFEMLAIRVKPYGFEIEMTEEIGRHEEINPGKIKLQQWRYEPTASYGGPKINVQKLTIKKLEISRDRKRLQLYVDGLKKEHVVYFRLPKWSSVTNRPLWSTESWYTLNNIPEDVERGN